MEAERTIPEEDPCCGAGRNVMVAPPPHLTDKLASDDFRHDLAAQMVDIPAGFFDMGARTPKYPLDFEGPRRKVFVSEFRISCTAVTNAQFARFVDESGYRTVAEIEGWSYVFHSFLSDPSEYPNSPPGTPWWRQVPGAKWFAPEGPGSSLNNREDHPVTQLSWFDAVAFCIFTGTRLPTEAEWEKAARGGLRHKLFPWGNHLVPPSGHRHNVWQGDFPMRDSGEDSYTGTCPVDAFVPNDFGLFNMTGNVWEMCSDWFGAPEIAGRPARDPIGPAEGVMKVLKGGSFLCHASYCERYKVHSRSRTTPDSSTGHVGFRVFAA